MYSRVEKSSMSNFDQVKVVSQHLNLSADFSKKELSGTCTYTLARADAKSTASIKHLILDVRTLVINSVTVNSTAAKFSLKKSVNEDAFGFGLHIPLDAIKDWSAKSQNTVTVDYHTTPQSEAIQWLSASQTLGKKHPYLFTQCQAIHARSLLPCQDTPAVKSSYSATITTPAPLRALMSAVNDESKSTQDSSKGTNTWGFKQAIPVPSYLIALAIGNLKSKSVGKVCAVWSEPEILDECAKEFEDTEKFLESAESFLIPYQWGRYDLLILPPSFPYGGMENPCLTFVTPTLLAGDKSLVDVIAHEAAHSWSGNLVTNCSWEHFWLNEGFTMYVQRRILAHFENDAKYDQRVKEQEFDALVDLKALKENVYDFGVDHEFTKLIPDLTGKDPDDAFSSVPYEKGYNFLFYLKGLVGGYKVMDGFLKAYFTKFKFQCITSGDMKDFFLSYFAKTVSKEKLDSIDWDGWMFKPGMPLVKNQFDTSISSMVNKLTTQWTEGNWEACSDKDIAKWTTMAKMYFLQQLQEVDGGFSHSVLGQMDKLYSFTATRNAEIRYRWLNLCLINDYKPVYGEVVKFISEQGRMKFVRPLYKALAKAKGGEKLAKDTFNKVKDSYHLITSKMVHKDLFSS